MSKFPLERFLAVALLSPSLCLGAIVFWSSVGNGQEAPGKQEFPGRDGIAAKTLAVTSNLELQGDIASILVDGVDRFLLKELESSIQKRMEQWPKPMKSEAKISDPLQYEAATKEFR